MNDHNIWVITDMDGTFLNHHSYDYQSAIPMIEQLKQQSIPVIFNTSKTFTETRQFQEQLKINLPFIVENGSAIYIPKDMKTLTINTDTEYENYCEIKLGKKLNEISEILNSIDMDHELYTGNRMASRHTSRSSSGGGSCPNSVWDGVTD